MGIGVGFLFILRVWQIVYVFWLFNIDFISIIVKLVIVNWGARTIDGARAFSDGSIGSSFGSDIIAATDTATVAGSGNGADAAKTANVLDISLGVRFIWAGAVVVVVDCRLGGVVEVVFVDVGGGVETVECFGWELGGMEAGAGAGDLMLNEPEDVFQEEVLVADSAGYPIRVG